MNNRYLGQAFERKPLLFFLPIWALSFLSSVNGLAQEKGRSDQVWFANGAKVGEVTCTTAILWTRTTAKPAADFSLLPILSEGLQRKEQSAVKMPTEVLPGVAGKVRVACFPVGQNEPDYVSGWLETASGEDFVAQFDLQDLTPNTKYRYRVEPEERSGDQFPAIVEGHFRTAPQEDQSTPIRFIVSTCQAVRSIDSGPQGHVAYQRMLDFDPHFFVHTGDILYYDKAPFCKSIAAARAKWNLMFAYQFNREFHTQVSSYFMKDDHDTLKNDCWPGQKYGNLTFDDGLKIFREQVPMGTETYRTFRWGKDVQVWMTEHRDFRSSNRTKDGPEKTILGREQKAWLKRTIRESDATWKFVIAPGPLVGPDKAGKSDNHSNAAFATEGKELRSFLSEQSGLFVICGDRHWQYYSQDPETGLLEMGCGPINDQHMFGGHPRKNATFHKYFSAKGGFLGITVDGETAKAEWFHVTSEDDSNKSTATVIHTEKFGGK